MAKKNNPAVSVIIAMYNAENFIAECLASLANQTMQDFEIIVVDDCSIDNSLKVVESFFATFGDKLKVTTAAVQEFREISHWTRQAVSMFTFLTATTF